VVVAVVVVQLVVLINTNLKAMDNDKSFTLIELLIVIAIIGILAGILIVSMTSATNSANDARRKADINQLVKAITIIKTTDGSLPTETNANCKLGSTNSSENCSGIQAKLTTQGIAIPKDPVSGNYYTYNRVSADDFTLTGTMSNSVSYTYNSATLSYFSGTPISGACGSAAKTYYASVSDYGSNTFCTNGTPSPSLPVFPTVSTPTMWTCNGIDGGASSSCTATKIASTCVSEGGLSCNETVVGSYVINSFVLSGTTTGTTSWTAPSGITNIEYLVVGGGGAGGYRADRGGGGGGAGGFRTGSLEVSSSSPLTIVVGAGGAAKTAYSNIPNPGNNSQLGSIISIGGAGGLDGEFGTVGGSGGGGSGNGDSGTQGTSGQGNNGGSGYLDSTWNAAGGGGGAGSAGVSAPGDGTGGAGGSGLSSSITGTPVIYAAGGGGGAGKTNSGANGGAGGAGGSSGVGGAGTGIYTGIAGNGAINTGSGGGGCNAGTSGKGGSGIVVIRFLVP